MLYITGKTSTLRELFHGRKKNFAMKLKSLKDYFDKRLHFSRKLMSAPYWFSTEHDTGVINNTKKKREENEFHTDEIEAACVN